MQLHQKIAFLLPFWCLCDRGATDHRHAILFTRDPHFMERFIRLGICFAATFIQSAWHLVRFMHYVSNKQSVTPSKDDGKQDNHYYIAKSLPQNFKMYMASVLPDGWLRYFAEQYGKQEVRVAWTKRAVLGTDRNWRIPVADLFEDHPSSSSPLKVASHLRPNPALETGNAFLYIDFQGKKKLYFVRDDTMEETDWVLAQKQGGNLFLNTLFNEMWAPAPSQQKVLNLVHQVTRDLQLENSDLREQLDRAIPSPA